MALDRTIAITLPDPSQERCFFWVKIASSDSPGGHAEVLLWRMLPYEVLIKWRWYFDYRAALYKVQNPRKYMQITCGPEQMEAINPVAYEKLMLSRKIRNCKGKITEWTRKVNDAVILVGKRSPMFPFENEPGYQAAMAKLAKKQEELKAFQERYAELDKLKS